MIKDSGVLLRLAGKIVNNTESDIYADVSLVSGDVYQHRNQHMNQHMNQDTVMYAQMSVKSNSVLRDEVQESMLEDYVRYEVGEQLLTTENVIELDVWDINADKLYIHKTNSTDTVQFGYRVVAPGFIPACSVNVFKQEEDSIGGYLGSSQIDESQEGEDINLMLGTSTKLQCTSQIVVEKVQTVDDVGVEDNVKTEDIKTKDIKTENNETTDVYSHVSNKRWMYVTTKLTTEITNYNTTDSNLSIKHYRGSDHLISVSQQNSKREEGYLEWYFSIPPTQESSQTFICEIVTAVWE